MNVIVLIVIVIVLIVIVIVLIGRYEGEMHDAKMHGEGVAHFPGGHVYKVALLTCYPTT